MVKVDNLIDFDLVYFKYHTLVSEIAKSYLVDEELSEELEQDVWVEYINEIAKKKFFKDEAHIKKWLIAVAKNIAIDTSRKCSSVNEEDVESELMDINIIQEIPGFQNKRIEFILGELEEMDNKYSTVFFMHYIENRKLLDISVELAISEDAVKKRLQRAREYIKLGLKSNQKKLINTF